MKASAGILIICFVALALTCGCSAHTAAVNAPGPATAGTAAQHAAAKDEWHGFKPPPGPIARMIEQHEAAMGHPMTGGRPAGNGPH